MLLEIVKEFVPLNFNSMFENQVIDNFELKIKIVLRFLLTHSCQRCYLYIVTHGFSSVLNDNELELNVIHDNIEIDKPHLD